MDKIFYSTMLSLTLLIAGCMTTGTYQSMSSGHVGCSPSDIQVENDSLNALNGTSSWEATCKGKKYFCSGSPASTSCKEAK